MPEAARRGLLRGLAIGGLALPGLLLRPARAAQQITVADNGGPFGPAFRRAFYDPFEAATGIRVANVVHEADPVAQFRSMVDARSYIWDACLVTPDHVNRLTRPRPYLELLELPAEATDGIIPQALTPSYLGLSVFGTVMAYRRDRFPAGGPANWADFWNVERFPGRRGLFKSPTGTLEMALLADGVPTSALYPLDVDRAFRSLDRIKRQVNVWWTSGAQSTQLLQSGEVDMLMIWSGRAQAAIDSGTPAEVVWSQGTFNMDGWSIPRGGPRTAEARQFVRFCADAARQASFTELMAYGPTNTRAYDFVPPARARLLPTAPDNLRGLVAVDHAWWAANTSRVTERFESWLLG